MRAGRWTASRSRTWRPPAPRRRTSTTTTSKRSRSRRPATTSRRRTGGIGLNMVVKRGTNQFRRKRPWILRQRVDGIVQRAGRVEGDGRHARDVRSQQADLRLRRRARRTDLPRQGLVLRLLFDSGRAARAARRRARRSHAAQEPEREGQLPGDEEGQRQLPVSGRVQDQGRPEPGRRRDHCSTRRPRPSTRTTRTPIRRFTASGRLPTITCSARTCSSPAKYAFYNTGFVLDPTGGLSMQAGRDFVHATSYGSINQSINIRPQHTATVDVQSLLQRLRRLTRPEVRLRLAARGGSQRHALARQHDPGHRESEQPAGAGVPPGLRRQPRPVCRFLRGGYDLAQPLDARSRPAVRSSERRGASERDAAERGVPDRRSRRRVRGLQDSVHVERLVSSRPASRTRSTSSRHTVARVSFTPCGGAAQYGNRRRLEIQAPRQVQQRIAGSI